MLGCIVVEARANRSETGHCRRVAMEILRRPPSPATTHSKGIGGGQSGRLLNSCEPAICLSEADTTGANGRKGKVTDLQTGNIRLLGAPPLLLRWRVATALVGKGRNSECVRTLAAAQSQRG